MGNDIILYKIPASCDVNIIMYILDVFQSTK